VFFTRICTPLRATQVPANSSTNCTNFSASSSARSGSVASSARLHSSRFTPAIP
jgi:hypothetical protein